MPTISGVPAAPLEGHTVIARSLLLAAAGIVLLTSGACANTTPAKASPPPAPLASSWYNTGVAAAPSVAPAQVAPGAYHPAVTSTGILPAVAPGKFSAAPAIAPSPSGPVACAPMLGPATNLPVTATPGTGTITAHWTDLSDPAVLTYRLAAIPNNGAPTKWLTVAATHNCTTLSTTITGLTKNTNYQIWLDAVHTVTAYGMNAVTQETMIGRSVAVTVL